jgi:predicted nucleic acid-binding protein
VSDIVVSDSTCLIALERIKRLDLLPAVFERVWIPPVVAAEFGQTFPWLHVKQPQNEEVVQAFEIVVDAGEAAAIVLARELHCEVILDDLQARYLAAAQGVPHLGLLGLLVRAKKQHKLDFVRPTVEALRTKGFFLSDKIVAEALRKAGE